MDPRQSAPLNFTFILLVTVIVVFEFWLWLRFVEFCMWLIEKGI